MPDKSIKKPPKKLTSVGLSMFVDTVELRNLPLPIVEIPIRKLLWHLDMPVWEKDGTDDWNLTPRQVLNKDPFTTDHQKIMAKANMRYPIIVTKYKSRYVILDGVHRLTKAFSRDKKNIKAKIIPSKYLKMREYKN